MQQTKVRGEGKLGREEPLSQRYNLLPNPWAKALLGRQVLGVLLYWVNGRRRHYGPFSPPLRQDIAAFLSLPHNPIPDSPLSSQHSKGKFGGAPLGVEVYAPEEIDPAQS